MVDDTEFFTVSLESIDNVMVNGFATVQISDDDGELYNTNVHVYNCYQQEWRKWSSQSGNGRTTFQGSNNRRAHKFQTSLAEDILYIFLIGRLATSPSFVASGDVSADRWQHKSMI